MKKLIKVKKGDRYNFTGIFDSFSIRYDKYAKRNKYYIIIRNVKDEYGNHVANYVSFDYIKTFSDLMLIPEDIIAFRARIVACQSMEEALECGFLNPYSNLYCRLMNPTKARKLIRAVERIPYREPCKINISNLVK